MVEQDPIHATSSINSLHSFNSAHSLNGEHSMEIVEQDPINTTSFNSFDEHESTGSSDEMTWTRSGRRTSQLRTMFADAAAMKAKLHATLSKPEYNVAMYYHKHGLTQRIARSSWFEQFTLVVIALNAIWIGIDTDYNPSPVLAHAPIGFQIVEQLFCFYFVGEWLIRFLAFKKKLNGFRDAWFVFDSMLTLLIVVDSWVMYLVTITGSIPGGGLGDASILRIFRLLRLTRIGRMARMFKAVPELVILLRAMGAAMRAVGMILSVQLSLLYIFGIAFKHLCSDAEQAICNEYFVSVPRSAHTLLIHGVFMDNLGDLVNPLQKYSIGLLLFFYCFLWLSALSVMNMLIGLFCDVVNATSTVEKEALSIIYVTERLQQIMLRAGMKSIVKGDSSISKEEFLQILEIREATEVLKEVGVDVVSLIDFADFIFKADDPEFQHEEGGRKISFARFVEVMLDLRGNNNAAVRDVVGLRRFMQSKVAGLEAKLEAVISYSRRTYKSGMENTKLLRSSSMDVSAVKSTPDVSSVETRFDISSNQPREGNGTDDLLSLSERVGAIDRDLGKLIESLALEHHNAMVTLRRGNERLQSELDVLRSLSKHNMYLDTEGKISQQRDSVSPTMDKLISLQHHVTAQVPFKILENNSFIRGTDVESDSKDQSKGRLNNLDGCQNKCDRELSTSAPRPLNTEICQTDNLNLAVASQARYQSMPADQPVSLTL